MMLMSDVKLVRNLLYLAYVVRRTLRHDPSSPNLHKVHVDIDFRSFWPENPGSLSK